MSLPTWTMTASKFEEVGQEIEGQIGQDFLASFLLLLVHIYVNCDISDSPLNLAYIRGLINTESH